MNSKKRKTSLDIFIEEKFADAKPGAKYGVLLLIIGILGAAFYFGVFMTVTEDIKALDSKSGATKKEIRQATNKADMLEERQRVLDETKGQFTTMVSAFSNQDQLPYLLASISEIGRSVGLEFKQFKPGKEEHAEKPDPEGKQPKKGKARKKKASNDSLDFYTRTPLEITIKGSYYSLIMFLDRISQLDRIVTMHDIDMDNPQLEGTEMILDTHCRLIMYKYAEPPKDPPKESKKKKK